MSILAKDRTIIRAPAPRFTKTGYWKILTQDPAFQAMVDLLNTYVQGIWRFNKRENETDAMAAFRCGRNLKIGASNLALDRQWPGGPPTFFRDYARFRNDTPLVTREFIQSLANGGTGEGSLFVVAKCPDTTIGTTGTKRAWLAGTYGNNQNSGLGLLFNNYPNQLQGLGYQVTDEGSGRVRTAAINVNTGTIDLWRILFLDWDAATLAARNLAGDSAVPAPLTLVGGNAYGTQPLTIGGRITSGLNFDADTLKDIAFVLLLNKKVTDEQRVFLTAFLRLMFDETALLYLNNLS
ncbi:hypothetical protein [Mesorhizobium sp. CN2-181]|uniref:hypothetical protein n=1 Tax=Mesorhizobium yinganensis TaxID=3157707 RepID=UPI0032B87FEB